MASRMSKKVVCPSCGAIFLTDAAEESPEEEERAREITTSAGNAASAFRPTRYILPAVLACLFLAVGAAVYLAFAPGAPETFLKPALEVVGPAVFLDSDPGSPPDMIVYGYDPLNEKYRLARISPAQGKVVWRGRTFEEIGDLDRIAAAGGRFFTVEGTVLHGYSAADGRGIWQAELPDKIGYCDECLSAAGDSVIVMTLDYTLQAYDAAGGRQLWSRRLAGYTRGFWIVGDTLLLIDAEQGEEYSLVQLSITGGNPLRVITPECRGEGEYSAEGLDAHATVVPDADGSVYLLYGYSPACIEHWDLASGERAWQTVEAKGFSPSRDYAVLAAAEEVFFAEGKSLWAFERATGRARLIDEEEDYEILPVAFSGGRLIVRAKRTRGTARFELWGMDPEYGEKIWRREMETGAPLDPPDEMHGTIDEDNSAWTLIAGDGGLALLEFRAQPNRLAVTALDAQSGEAAGEKTIKLWMADDYFTPEVVGRRDSIYWVLLADNIIGIDYRAGKIAYRYP